ncbi:MAG: hypoxanthine phosphoribosyltransferase [candidate division WOR-3 bacterium]|nr:hypoxanthine phosphoribosyltransferase [candidate division WOR-3 bacterium]
MVRIIPLISETRLNQKVEKIARQISKDYKNTTPLLVGVLKGAWVFMADLVRNITIPVNCDFLQVSSYGYATESSGVVKIVTDLKCAIENRDIILVEDIVDTGLTLKYITDYLALKKPRSIKICSLLDKPARHKIKVKIDYLGFKVPNKFVVGYGIDYQELYRNLPYIAYVEFDNKKNGSAKH